MTRARIEGLLSTFPKLMGSGKQHTFVESDSVRYVYQPLERLYVLLITTKESNILEDLETLRLFSRVVSNNHSNMSSEKTRYATIDAALTSRFLSTVPHWMNKTYWIRHLISSLLLMKL